MANNTTPTLLNKRKSDILQTWINYQIEDPALREDLMSNEEMRNQSEELLDAFLQVIKYENYEDISRQEYNSIIEILSGISLSRAHGGFTPRETAIYVLSLKKAIIRVLQEELKGEPDELVNEILNISNLLDSLSLMTFETYVKGREEVIQRQSNEMNEVSTPVIRVWEGVLALPIIGTLDSERTQVVMENLLQEIVDTGSGIAILDISGVPAVDTLVAQHLIKTVNATRLMGAECIISGIKPEIAQTIVHLGINLEGVQTKATLASALKQAFNKMNLVVTKKKLG
ncbi:rsbT co-antagonist protein RsbR [Catalinimonas alkaloidigena]|uniref:STAS domain-containing protein n=1 Tax=Catalinimonas alkaloidigena TaxID=1075417 RepID=UPI0024074580|nr:STAS domain-containing protein [Catalinimonas alkaloidigena]MDF9798836.1 rsbT co-antagonist protein RsbR [Catalinimonas alkaloidigena]